MSSQVITTYPEPAGGTGSRNPTDHESEGEGQPGKQKNFYRHVSGAGEGHTLQTTSDYSNTNTHIVDPIKANGEIMDDEPRNELNGLEQNTNQDNGASAKEMKEENKQLEPDWQKKIRSLQDQVILWSFVL